MTSYVIIGESWVKIGKYLLEGKAYFDKLKDLYRSKMPNGELIELTLIWTRDKIKFHGQVTCDYACETLDWIEDKFESLPECDRVKVIDDYNWMQFDIVRANLSSCDNRTDIQKILWSKKCGEKPFLDKEKFCSWVFQNVWYCLESKKYEDMYIKCEMDLKMDFSPIMTIARSEMVSYVILLKQRKILKLKEKIAETFKRTKKNKSIEIETGMDEDVSESDETSDEDDDESTKKNGDDDESKKEAFVLFDLLLGPKHLRDEFK